jgi:hypothetical protein
VRFLLELLAGFRAGLKALFDGHAHLQARVFGQVDVAHATPTEQAHDPVPAAYHRAGWQWAPG